MNKLAMPIFRFHAKSVGAKFGGIVLAGMMASQATGQVVDLDASPIGERISAMEQSHIKPEWITPGGEAEQAAAEMAKDARLADDRSVLQVQAQVPTPLTDGLATPPPLNTTPNAPISDLVPPAPGLPGAGGFPGAGNGLGGPVPNLSNNRFGAGSSRGSFASAPTMMGDFFGGGFSQFGGSQTVSFSQHADATLLSGSPGDSDAILGFEFGGDVVPNDIFTNGNSADGMDLSGDSFIDTLGLSEPIPPSDALTSPGIGFVFDGGTATYTQVASSDAAANGTYQTGSGESWLISYSYTQALDSGSPSAVIRPLPGPGVSARRVKLSENFSPEVRDRFFFNYNFFNDTFGGLGDISRYVLGMERMLVDDLFSVEVRLPMAGTYGSTQDLAKPEDRDFEFGNLTLIGKTILLRGDRFIWSGGLGVGAPTADDSRLQRNGEDLLVVKNRSVHLLPFTSLFYRYSKDTFFQTYLQADVAANGDPVFGDLTGGNLPKLGTFTDSTLLYLDFAVNRVLYRNRCSKRVRQVIGNAELHYTSTLQDSDSVGAGNLTYTNLKRNFDIVNTTVGAHIVMANNFVISPAIAVPLSSGLDKQFDYEAIVQLNYTP